MRLRLTGIAIVGAVWWWWPEAAPPALDLVVATTTDTFAILDRTSWQLTEIAHTGQPDREVRVPRLEDARVVGTLPGTSLVWKDKKKIALARVDTLEEKQVWGKRVDKLCAQTATTHRWFGVSWLESDGAIWILRGPSMTEATRATELAIEQSAALPYCAIAAGGDDVFLLYQNRSRYELVRCPERGRCLTPRKVSIDAKHSTILGFGCNASSCVFGARDDRDKQGRPSLYWIDHAANKVDSVTLGDGAKNSVVTIAGAGDRFAIGYTNGDEPIVVVSEKPGYLTELWSGGDPDTVPAVSWMANVLMIASQRDGELVTRTRRF